MSKVKVQFKNKIMKIKFIILQLLFVTACVGQQKPEKYKFNFQLDNRLSSIRNNTITLFGAKVGLQYKNLTRFGAGVSFIVNPVEISYINKKTKLEETNTINFWYGSLFNDWILYKNNKWECFVTEQIGFGKPTFVREVGSETVNDIAVPIFVNEISAQVNYKLFNWAGIGAGFGYRNLWNGDTRLKTTLNAPIYIFKLIIYPEVIFYKQ